MLENDDPDEIPLASTFTIGSSLLGISARHIQEIIKLTEITEVPHSPDYIPGILNLRGRIVTVIDLGVRLALVACTRTDLSRIVIIDDGAESVGLLVDRVADVIPIDPGRVQPSPPNLNAVQGRFFENVYQSADGLVGLLSFEAILNHA